MDLGSLLEALVGFVRDNQAWLAPAVFALAFLESLAFVSLIVPATALLGALGVLIGAGQLPFWPPFLAAAAGAFVGDAVSFEIGRRWKEEVKGLWPLNRQPELFDRGERFLQRYGLPGYFGGRFIGPLRAVFPLVCGIASLRPLSFQAVNAASAVAWAGAYLGLGVSAGRFFG